ncbi:Fatty acyl-CoA reductase 1 [Eufriesea mexicana]|uniref:Fatty acyl-CoA reductase n=1 Tax=Eufriesea mexicana TaxID=516756 RepID=A0A310SL79_9HYME|nr:Fatty acyl-CoA reductase 1 [Eufriesea mexicana]
MKDANRTPHPNDERSSAKNCNGQIRQFYAGKRVLLTGCTGFLGTVAVEKILRTCKEISKLYIMVRQKKGISVEERLNHFFKNDIFDKLREINPNFMEKIEVIYGDLEKEDLGFSPEDRRRLVENVNIIIHNASMVYFVAKVSRILRTNVIAMQKLLELARECGQRIQLYTSEYIHTDFHSIETDDTKQEMQDSDIRKLIQISKWHDSELAVLQVNDVSCSYPQRSTIDERNARINRIVYGLLKENQRYVFDKIHSVLGNPAIYPALELTTIRGFLQTIGQRIRTTSRDIGTMAMLLDAPSGTAKTWLLMSLLITMHRKDVVFLVTNGT